MRRRVALYFFYVLTSILLCCKEDSTSQDTPSKPAPNQFKNPILTNAADPWVFQKNDWYYITYTTGNNVRLFRSKQMSDLSSANAKTIWTPPPTGMNSRNIWAPEIHFVNNKWYIYYAADDGDNVNHRMWVLENDSEDPFEGTWVDKGELELPDDKWAIDGTVFTWNGQLYFLWSGWAGDTNIRQDIYIAEMTDPLTVQGPRILLSKPELTWELHGGTPSVNEGPQFITHGEKNNIIYSASGCWTDNYSLGLLTADVTSNPKEAVSWTKNEQPIFVTRASGGTFGPGHNAFFKSLDGSEDWMIYHANNAADQGCGELRSIRIQKFNWNEDDTPNFGQPTSLFEAQRKPAGEEDF